MILLYNRAILTTTELYDPVIGILRIFCPIFVFMGYSRLLGTHILTPSGRQRFSNRAQIAAAVSNIILNAILIPKLFSAGAAIASVISEFIIAALYLFLVRKDVVISDILKAAWKKLLAAMIMFAAVYPLRNIRESSILLSFSLMAEGMVVYMLVLLIMRDSFTLEHTGKAIHGAKKIFQKIFVKK